MFAVFVPVRLLITNVTNALQAVVTTEDDHEFSVGDYVRIIVPPVYGMNIFYQQVQIVAIPDTDQIQIDYDTTPERPFVAPTYPPAFTAAQLIPITGVEDNVA